MRKVQTPSDAASMESYRRDLSKAPILIVYVSLKRFGEHSRGNPPHADCYLECRVKLYGNTRGRYCTRDHAMPLMFFAPFRL